MDNLNLYQDIQARTNGDIYIGVVGPVRTGKSTFIKKFMDLMGNSILAICEMIYFISANRRYEVYFTRKQYKEFKRIYYETKNKK